jgi:hypothetical protein
LAQNTSSVPSDLCPLVSFQFFSTLAQWYLRFLLSSPPKVPNHIHKY